MAKRDRGRRRLPTGGITHNRLYQRKRRAGGPLQGRTPVILPFALVAKQGPLIVNLTGHASRVHGPGSCRIGTASHRTASGPRDAAPGSRQSAACPSSTIIPAICSFPCGSSHKPAPPSTTLPRLGTDTAVPVLPVLPVLEVLPLVTDPLDTVGVPERIPPEPDEDEVEVGEVEEDPEAGDEVEVEPPDGRDDLDAEPDVEVGTVGIAELDTGVDEVGSELERVEVDDGTEPAPGRVDPATDPADGRLPTGSAPDTRLPAPLRTPPAC